MTPLRADALAIWQAGVAAVDSQQLVQQAIHATPQQITFGDVVWKASPGSRICVVGAGKAGTGMVRGAEAALADHWGLRLSGWVNVPDDCVPQAGEPDASRSIRLHGARPAGLNEPTTAGVQGTEQILALVSQLREEDLCLVLISGGGSALLPAPLPGISLTDKQLVTRTLSRAGATIEELNCVRRALSRVKGGGLSRACTAGTLVSLIISDVAGDPLATIASGPTVEISPEPVRAMQLVREFFARANSPVPAAVEAALQARRTDAPAATRTSVHNLVIGNNRTAVEAAKQAAQQLGYEVALAEWDQPGEAADVGRNLAQQLAQRQSASPHRKTCLISGGEPTVHIAPSTLPQKGGRNQELVLAALCEWLPGFQGEAVLVSGGTDGEDGPTDAAGAWIDQATLRTIRQSPVNPMEFLKQHNSYPFLDQFGLLLKTGPTHTNVMDLRVGVCGG